MSGIVWLASYPKSGNTWVRVFLANYLRNIDTPADINELNGDRSTSSREMFDELTGIEASDLTDAEIQRLRPAVYRILAARSTGNILMKTHDSWTRSAEGRPVVGIPEVTRQVLYLIRNPLDVAVSFANHEGSSIDRAIDTMAAPDASFACRPGHLSRQLAQPLNTWSGHVRSWVEESGLPVMIVRYEDLSLHPMESFGTIVRAFGLELDTERLAQAMRFSSFDSLQAQEQKATFRERPQRAARFFRKGVVGDWREQLSDEQVDRVISNHRETMLRYGYLEDVEGGDRPSEAALQETESAPTAH